MTEETKLRERSASKVMNMTMPKDFSAMPNDFPEMNMDIWPANGIDETESQKVASSHVASEIDAGSAPKPRKVFKESSFRHQKAQESPSPSLPST